MKKYIGVKLICINNSGELYLTKGKEYINLLKQKTFIGCQYHVLDDRGKSNNFPAFRFKNIIEDRNNKLKKLK